MPLEAQAGRVEARRWGLSWAVLGRSQELSCVKHCLLRPRLRTLAESWDSVWSWNSDAGTLQCRTGDPGGTLMNPPNYCHFVRLLTGCLALGANVHGKLEEEGADVVALWVKLPPMTWHSL